MQQGDYTSTTPYYHNYPQNPNLNPITTDLHHPPVTYASAPPFTNTTTYHPPTSEYYPPYPQQNPDPLPPTAPSYAPPPPNPNPQPSSFPQFEASHTPYQPQQPHNPPYDHHQTPPTYPSRGRVDYYGKRPDVGMSRFESSGGYGEGVYAYQGGKVEPYGSRGTASKSSTWKEQVIFDDFGRPIGLPGKDSPSVSSPKIVKAVANFKGGVQKFRVKLLAESGGQSTMDVLCQIGSDGIRMLDPSTGRTLRIYPLDTITRCEVYDSSTFAFWSKSSLDIEPRRIRLQSNSYTTNTLLDTVTIQMTKSNVSTHHTLSIRSILDKEKLSGPNFLDWFRNVRIVLRNEKKDHILDGPIPDEPPANASKAIKDTWAKLNDDSNEVACLMLASMVPELQKTFEFHTAFDMIEQLKLMFQVQAKQERFETMTAFISCKMTEGSSVSEHVLKMKAYTEQLSRLGFSISDELATDVILGSLPKSFNRFVLNYNMNNWEKSISELHSMLKTAEANIKKSGTQVLMVREGKISKNVKTGNVTGKGKAFKKGKGKDKDKGKASVSKPAAKPKPTADADCFHCGQKGHWKRNCPIYLEEVKKNKANTIAIDTSGSKEC